MTFLGLCFWEVDAYYPWPKIPAGILKGTVGISNDPIRIITRGRGPVSLQVGSKLPRLFEPTADGLTARFEIQTPEKEYFRAETLTGTMRIAENGTIEAKLDGNTEWWKFKGELVGN